MKRTVLSDSLELELNARSINEWRFRVREGTCDSEDCYCELIVVDWFGHPLEFSCDCDKCSASCDPYLRKSWTREEVSRRRNISDFAQSIIDQLSEMVSD